MILWWMTNDNWLSIPWRHKWWKEVWGFLPPNRSWWCQDEQEDETVSLILLPLSRETWYLFVWCPLTVVCETCFSVVTHLTRTSSFTTKILPSSLLSEEEEDYVVNILQFLSSLGHSTDFVSLLIISSLSFYDSFFPLNISTGLYI